jgi:hypothetical protein
MATNRALSSKRKASGNKTRIHRDRCGGGSVARKQMGSAKWERRKGCHGRFTGVLAASLCKNAQFKNKKTVAPSFLGASPILNQGA